MKHNAYCWFPQLSPDFPGFSSTSNSETFKNNHLHWRSYLPYNHRYQTHINFATRDEQGYLPSIFHINTLMCRIFFRRHFKNNVHQRRCLRQLPVDANAVRCGRDPVIMWLTATDYGVEREIAYCRRSMTKFLTDRKLCTQVIVSRNATNRYLQIALVDRKSVV